MRRTAQLLATGALLATACAHANKADVVWPEPPETPRIKFVTHYRSDKDVGGGAWEEFKRALVGSGTKNLVVRPMSIALSADGERLYVADSFAANVLLIDLKGNSFKRALPDGEVREPFGVALDSDENLYVSDTKSKRVYVYGKDGKKLRSMVKEADRPTALAIDRTRGLLYVVDSSSRDSQHHCVLVYTLQGELVRTIGRRGERPGEFNFPIYVALDEAGDLFVGDTMNFRIQIFDPNGTFLRTFGEQGDVPGTFGRIKGLAFDGFGNLYVIDAEHAGVQMFNGQLQLLMTFAGWVPKIEFLELPTSIAIDRQKNRIYVADTGAYPRINVYQLINTTREDSIPRAPTPNGSARP